MWGLAFGPHPKNRPGAICQASDSIDDDVQRLLLATGLNNGIIKIWRVATGEKLLLESAALTRNFFAHILCYAMFVFTLVSC